MRKDIFQKKMIIIRHKYISLLIICFTIMVIAGLYQKQGYTNLNEVDTPLENYATGILTEQSVEMQIEVMSNELKNQPIILAVTCESDYYFRYSCATQKVTIDKIFVGNDFQEGQEISILMSNLIETKDDEEALINGKPIINMGYTNQMKKGNKYLVFLSRKLENGNQNDIFLFSDEFRINPVFSYTDIVNIPLESEVNYASAISYKKAKENEFFFNNQESIDKFALFKKDIINSYQPD